MGLLYIGFLAEELVLSPSGTLRYVYILRNSNIAFIHVLFFLISFAYSSALPFFGHIILTD